MPNTWKKMKELQTHVINGEVYVKLEDAKVLQSYIEDLNHAVDEMLDYIEQYSDVEDGDYGVPYPNDAMRLISRVEGELGRSETW